MGPVTELSIRQTTRLDDVPPSAWNELARNCGAFASAEYLAGLEAEDIFDCQYLLAIGSGRQLLGGLPVYCADDPSASSTFYDPRIAFAEPLDLPAKSQDWSPALLVGTRSGFWNRLPLSSYLDAAQRRYVIRELLSAVAEQVEARALASVALMYATSDTVAELAPLLPPEASVLLAGAHMVLHPVGEEFGDYLDSLSGKRRYLVRTERARFDAAGYDTRVTDLREACGWAAPLLCNVDRKYGLECDTDREFARLNRAAATINEASRVFVAERDGRPVAIALGFRWQDELHMWGWGCDYGRLDDAAEYFNITYYLPIEMAAQTGCSAVYFGIESYRAKAMRGAVPAPVYSVLLAGPQLARADRVKGRRNSTEVAKEIDASVADIHGSIEASGWLAWTR